MQTHADGGAIAPEGTIYLMMGNDWYRDTMIIVYLISAVAGIMSNYVGILGFKEIAKLLDIWLSQVIRN